MIQDIINKRWAARKGFSLLCVPLLALTAIMSSCSNDGDIVTVGKGDAITLDGSNIIKLDETNATGLALTLHWNDNHQLSTNYYDVLVPSGSLKNTLQISRTEDFASCYSCEMASGVYQKQFTNAELNGELTKLLFTPYEEQDMFVRVATTTGANIEPQYSNVLAFKVIPYHIDYTTASALSTDKTTVIGTLYSPEENGIYTGFMSLGAWGNWWMMENDGTMWGNDDVTGTAFVISNASTAWNFWASGFNGCRYVTVNTKQKYWTDLTIPSVTVSGDITGDMTYNKETKQWTLCYTAASTSPVSVSFASPDSKLYNQDTGDSEANGVATPVTFTSNGISSDGSAAETITLTAPQTGDCTLTIDLSGETPAYSIEAGSTAPVEEISPILCVMGNDDKWDHTEWIRLSDEDNKTYTGAVYMNSSWGFYFTKTTADDDWTKINQDPDTSDKKLKEGGSDITAPGTGLYIMSASLGWMSYWYEMDGAAVTSVSCTGFNDDWGELQMTATSTPGVYTASVTITADTPWGVKILINGSWDYWFGTNSDGTLVWNKKEDGAPAGIDGNGTYIFTVDICHGTYTMEKVN